jgi:hypothetical protein
MRDVVMASVAGQATRANGAGQILSGARKGPVDGPGLLDAPGDLNSGPSDPANYWHTAANAWITLADATRVDGTAAHTRALLPPAFAAVSPVPMEVSWWRGGAAACGRLEQYQLLARNRGESANGLLEAPRVDLRRGLLAGEERTRGRPVAQTRMLVHRRRRHHRPVSLWSEKCNGPFCDARSGTGRILTLEWLASWTGMGYDRRHANSWRARAKI